MSHEIRTPMTGIIGLLDLCLKTELSEEQSSYLEKVKFSANSLLIIINDILDFSKIESGELNIENIPFEHDKVIDSLNVMVGQVAEEKGIELIFDLDRETPEVMIGDPVRLMQILLNLLSNAVKFTNEGHVVLRTRLIKATDTDDEKSRSDYILYQVEDTGIGLSAEAESKLFQRFTQADESTTRKYGGTGLGLAITKLLVGFMSGDIKLRSQEGKGTVVSITLPLNESEQTNKSKHSKTIENASQHKDLRILLLEDNKITQSVITKMAHYHRITIDVVESVKAAKELCQVNQYDIALVDWNLQGESGLDFISVINKESYCPKLLVVCSAYSKGYIEGQSGVEVKLHYLAKPLTLFSFNKLLSLYENSKLTGENLVSDESLAKEAKQEESLLIISKDKPQKILLVEDNKINRLIATKILESLGLLVDIAEDGREALEKVSIGKYPVVLMDIQMPVMDGIEATMELRKTYNQEQLKIIALTANITSADIEYYSSIGMNGYLGKPYEVNKIRAALTEYYQ